MEHNPRCTYAADAHMQVYLIDGFETPASAVAALKQAGAFPVCYFR